MKVRVALRHILVAVLTAEAMPSKAGQALTAEVKLYRREYEVGVACFEWEIKRLELLVSPPA